MRPGSRVPIIGLAVAVVVAVAAVSSGAGAVGADPAEPARAPVGARAAGVEGACPTAAGVTMVVDFQD
ncbi:MAG: hypothetical protein M9906_11735, partial [Microthrixaceae bacterium]|nr:hypothetical protein [Microthrixaceae bacterium]